MVLKRERVYLMLVYENIGRKPPLLPQPVTRNSYVAIIDKSENRIERKTFKYVERHSECRNKNTNLCNFRCESQISCNQLYYSFESCGYAGCEGDKDNTNFIKVCLCFSTKSPLP